MLTYKAQLAKIDRSINIQDTPEDSIGYLISQFLKTSAKKNYLYIAKDEVEMTRIAKSIKFFNTDVNVLKFPQWDCMPYDISSPKRETMARRMEVLHKIISDNSKQKTIIITTPQAFIQKIPSRHLIQKSCLTLESGDVFSVTKLEKFLELNGYTKSSTAGKVGEYAVRDNIVDVVTDYKNSAFRVQFIADIVNDIKRFDVSTQISSGIAQQLNIIPADEVILRDEEINNFRANYRDLFGAVSKDDELYHKISAGEKVRGMEHWLPLFYNDDMETILDYLPDYCILKSDASDTEINDAWHTVCNFYEDRNLAVEQRNSLEKKAKGNNAVLNRIKSQFLYNPIDPELLYLSKDKVEKIFSEEFVVGFNTVILSARDCCEATMSCRRISGKDTTNENGAQDSSVRFSNHIRKSNSQNDMLTSESHSEPVEVNSDTDTLRQVQGTGRTINLSISPTPHFAELTQQKNKNTFDLLSEHLEQKQDKQVIVTAINTNSLERLNTLLESSDIHCQEIKNVSEIATLPQGKIALVKLPLNHGFELNDLIVVTEQDLLGEKVVRRSSYSTKDITTILKEVSGLQVGELVVHKEHGVGRFLGLETIEIQGIRNDFLKIEYGNGDNLFLPVEDIDVITRYGSDSDLIGLDKLGGASSWIKKRRKIRRNIMAIANELIKIAVQRKLKKAPTLSPEIGEYNEFCAKFPYTATTDQEKSISDIEEDLMLGTPMDRLVCGDVGFGKTEVAMRAAFMVARASGHKKQVALIAPTTLLCRQHYKNFIERFAGTDVRIATLSRMVSIGDAKIIKKKLEEGKIDIIVGTHALLAEDIKFKDLGLLIVDEEQRFGVKQKEKLKEIRNNVHILTLSATPIPRTLQMSMSGIRELSIIATPPVDRLAIKTFVMPYDDIIIREAILREHYRGGQTFFVVPRIKDIPDIENRLRETVPEIKFKVAHGQMPPKQLDDIMNQFYDGKFDLLLATTIIESGIDVPRANTMIIHRANMFGLSQLYQLRGRVGRSKTKAFAYLTLQSEKDITDTAEKRLEVMETLDSLGAGFTVASHDMDIRGSGNLLGEEQSGNIKEVGVELYNDMLKEAIAKLKESKDGLGVSEDDEDEFTPQVKMSVSTMIPNDYIEDLTLRMSMYRRIAEINGVEQANELRGELTDRFGKIPQEVENLMQIAVIKHRCKDLNIEKLIGSANSIAVQFFKDKFENPEKLMGLVFASKGRISIKEGQKLVFVNDVNKKQTVLENMLGVMSELGSVV